MGCGGSTDSNSVDPVDYRRPKISIRIGNQVQNPNGLMPKIIFIFGGPGSRKGRIIDDLVNTYGFILLSAEELILNGLPESVNEDEGQMPLDTTLAVQKVLRDNPQKLTLDHGLKEVENAISDAGEMDMMYIVDIMPNLRFMLIEDFFLKECADEMAKFEQKYPCLFALNLAVPEDKLPNAEKYCAKPETENSDLLRDEVDVSRTQKRRSLYEFSVQSFLEYFRSTGRLVTVDTSCGVADFIWLRVAELFSELHFSHIGTVNTVIIFCFDRQELEGLDVERYGLCTIDLQYAVDNPQASIETLLEMLCKVIDKSGPAEESFLVFLEGTSLTSNSLQMTEFQKRAVCFVEIEEGYLHKYIQIVRTKRKGRKNSLFKQRFTAVCTLDNEICLFPQSIGHNLCRQIALCMSDYRRGTS